MSKSEITKRYSAACRFAQDAGRQIMTYFSESVAVERKRDDSPVTIADREAEWSLRKAIEEAFPDDHIMGEEHGEKAGTNAYRWILDPIDGTKSFIAGVPLFGTMIGILRDGKPLAGIIEFPALDRRIHATIGQGAWWQEGTTAPRVAQVSSTPTLAESLYVTSEPENFHQRQAMAAHQNLERAAWYTRTWGDCYGYFLVATGRAALMVDPLLQIWDAAPLLPIITEAGGTYTDWLGEPNITSGHGIGSNGKVHAEALQILSPYVTSPIDRRMER